MTSPKTHAERMAELRSCFAARWHGYGLPVEHANAKQPGVAFEAALTYASELHAALEAERAKHAVVCEIVKTVDGTNETLRRQLGDERAKLRAAERVIQVLRGGEPGWALRDALDAYDRDGEPPYVCPGCHTVGGERCAPSCIDAAIEEERRNATESGDYDRDGGAAGSG